VKLAYGIFGFIKFLKGYYIILITDRKKIAKIGRHSIYKVKDTKMVPLFKQMGDQREEEQKYVQCFLQIHFQKGFYYSYTYDLTHTLQFNIMQQVRKKQDKGLN